MKQLEHWRERALDAWTQVRCWRWNNEINLGHSFVLLKLRTWRSPRHSGMPKETDMVRWHHLIRN